MDTIEDGASDNNQQTHIRTCKKRTRNNKERIPKIEERMVLIPQINITREHGETTNEIKALIRPNLRVGKIYRRNKTDEEFH